VLSSFPPRIITLVFQDGVSGTLPCKAGHQVVLRMPDWAWGSLVEWSKTIRNT
jgi:hypothetical protein